MAPIAAAPATEAPTHGVVADPAAAPGATAPGGASPVATAAATDSLGAAEIPIAVKKVLNRLRHLEHLLQPTPEVTRIEEGLPAVTAFLEDLKRISSTTQPDLLAPRGLEDAILRWKRYEATLDDWMASLEKRTSELEAAGAELRATGDLWKSTRERAGTGGVPESLLEPIDSVLRGVEDLSGRLADRFDRVLTLQGRVGELVDLTQTVLSRFEDVRRERAHLLYRAEAPPLWRALAGSGLGSGLAGQALRTSAELELAARDFMTAYGNRVPWHALVYLLLVLTLVALGRSARRLHPRVEEEESLAAARHIFERPFSSGFILALLLTGLLYPLAPPAVFRLQMVLGLVPLLRLLPRLIRAEMRGPLYALTLLVALLQIVLMTPEGTILQRLLLLAVNLLGIGAAAWIGQGVARARAAGPVRRGPIARFARSGPRLGAIILIVAAGANLTGRVWLGDILTTGTIVSAYAALIVFAAVLVLDGVAATLLLAGAGGLRSFREHQGLLRSRVRRLLDYAALAVWMVAALASFRILTDVVAAFRAGLSEPLRVGSLQVALGDLATLGVTIWISFVLSRLTRFVLGEEILPRTSVEPGVRPLILMLVHYVIIALGVVLGIAAAGFPVDRLTLLVSALGVGIGFGLQNLVNNFVSGLSLIFEQPIRIGDLVQIGTLNGRIESIGIRATVVRTAQGAEVIVPNADLISKEVTNWTLSDSMRRLEVVVGVAYGTDLRRVIEILLTVARSHSEVIASPEPLVLFQRFGDSSLEFVLRFWTMSEDRWFIVESDVRLAVYRALADAGIVIPYPQRDVRVIGSAEVRGKEPVLPA
jgi:potassium-dependent mechanosensitive channel